MKALVRERRLAAFAFVALLCLTFGTLSPSNAAPKMPVIGLVMKSLANEFFKTMEEGAVQYEKAQGNFKLIPLGMKNETDVDAQIGIVENLITQKVDAIVIAPADSTALVPPLKKALQAGIKVINIDVALDKNAMKQNGIDLAFVGPDNRLGARLAGEYLAKALGAGGKAIIIEGNPGADNAKQRKAGFDDAVKSGKLNLLASRTAHWETEEAFKVFSSLLTAYPDVQGVMCANDSEAIGVVQAIDAAGKTGKIKVVGFDNIAPAQKLLREGKLLATVEQYGPKMAVFGIQYAFKELNGESLKGWIKTPVKLITKENVGQ